MKDSSPIPWEELTDSGRGLLIEIAQLLSARTTVRVRFDLHEGGVRDYKEERAKTPKDLGRSAANGGTA